MQECPSKKELILSELNEQQKLPVIDYVGPSIIIAAAGAGKTKTLVSRTAYMIEEGIPARQILLFTFTHKAAEEIKQRVMDNIGSAAKDVTVGTYHSFCARFLRKYIEILNIWNSKFSIYDADESRSIIKNILKNNIIKTKLKPQDILPIICRWKEEMLTPFDAQNKVIAEKDRNLEEIVNVYVLYQQELKKNNAVDFDDLIFLTIQIFEKYPDILKRVNDRYSYIVADESQDSSPRDLLLIKLLAGEKMNVCLIGDDFQSIYSFRGSNIMTFFDFVEEYNLKQFYLDRNYRSTQNVVNAAQSVIKNNKMQFEKNVFSENAVGEKIRFFSFPSSRTEASKVANIIKILNKKYKLKDMAILYRTSAQSRVLEDSLLAQAIPYQVVSGLAFYARKEIKDLLSYLKFLINPSDEAAFSRAVNIPKRGIGEASLNKIKACFYDNKDDIITSDDIIKHLEEVKVTGKTKTGLDNFTAVIKELANLYKENTKSSDLIKTLINITNYEDYLKNVCDDDEQFEDKKANIQELINIADEYDTLEEFIGSMVINTTGVDEANTEDKLNLMTIHASKGKEYDVVVIVGCGENYLPHAISLREHNVEEERRLFYVGMTRAKELLFLTNSEKVMVNRQLRDYPISRFVREIDSKYLQYSMK